MGLDGGQSSFLCFLLPPDSLYSPPCSPPLLDASWLPVYEEKQATADFIRAFVSSPEKVTAAISKAAVPASADRGSAACCRAAGGVLAGQSCFSQLSHTALHPQGSRPPGPVSPRPCVPLSHAPSLSLCPPAARTRARR